MSISQTACILDKDGYAYFWGLNNYGQYGVGNTATVTRPIKLKDYQWKHVFAGEGTTVAINKDGHLYAWGYTVWLNGDGFVGTPSTVYVPTLISDEVWTDAKCYYDSIIAIRSDGTLWSIGQNRGGNIADWNGYEKMKQIGTDRDWKAIGYIFHGVGAALKTDGTLWTWGTNDYGTLGRVNSGYIMIPMKISEIRFKFVTSGYYCVFGIDYEGRLWSWGYNNYGYLGIGNTTTYSYPLLPLAPEEVRFKKVATTYYGTLALDEKGQLWAWGHSYGYSLWNSTGTRNSPAIVDGYDKVEDIMGTYYSTIIRLKNGEIHVAGNNTYYLVQSNQNGNGSNYTRQKTTAFDHIDFDSLSYQDEVESNDAHTFVLHNKEFKRIKPGVPLVAHDADIPVPNFVTSLHAENGASIEVSSNHWNKHLAFNELYPSKGSNNYWSSRVGDTRPWIQFSLDEPMVLEKYFIAGPNETSSVQYMPTAWRIYASNDYVNWTVIERQEAIYNWEAKRDKTFKFYNKLPFKHYRFVVENLEANHVRIYNFRMLTAKAKIMPESPEWEFISNDLPVVDVFKAKGNKSFELDELTRVKRLSEVELAVPDSEERKSFTLPGTRIKKGMFPSSLRLEEI